MIHDVYDLIVVGSGAAGLAAACTAAAHGRRVVVLEASERIGGSTAVSGGMVWIPGNSKMRALGMEDSLDAAQEYLKHTVPGCVGDRRMGMFLARCGEAIAFLEARTSLRLQPVRRYPDYYPEAPGATAGGRVLEPVPFDGSGLGDDFALLRDPLPEFLLFEGMMVSREDLPVLRRIGRSPRAAWHAAKLVGRYALQRLRAHRGTTLVLGNALAARLLKSARDLGVDIATRMPVTALIQEQGRVVGIEGDCAGDARRILARDAVILATGGISHNTALKQRYIPRTAGLLSATVKSPARCSGADLATAVGAGMSAAGTTVDEAKAFWVPVSVCPGVDGIGAVFPHTVTDRAKPGLIAVDNQGRRFVNEAVSYHEFVRAQLRAPDSSIPAWLICDKAFLWKYGLGRVRPFALSIRRQLECGYLRKAHSLEALAESLRIPSPAFVETVRSFNAEAVHGRDPEFGRGSNIYQRHLGDADQSPNPCVAPIERAPFYAVAVYPADLGMAAGISTDEFARVLNCDAAPIPGLYACGNDMESVMNGAYPGPGITLGPGLVFGFLAASHACGELDALEQPSEMPRTSEASKAACNGGGWTP
ncbi:succinate dehydrogenase [Variovorax sp. WS11]|uniref:FAD-dependent oxidoreductase n=1 Tax=Variovorax sp. WS11 TaxID=1105204 RepID=UPI000D0E3015|nr:FAD-dependent oxidoreductase [Variovorax sp. WS11]NDZ18845.1 FAD-dependent oxidoreductase [Variovorax sp. WS11]PSL79366.1 succinate dehydrogenase [Variovorax sp. WS11]